MDELKADLPNLWPQGRPYLYSPGQQVNSPLPLRATLSSEAACCVNTEEIVCSKTQPQTLRNSVESPLPTYLGAGDQVTPPQVCLRLCDSCALAWKREPRATP